MSELTPKKRENVCPRCFTDHLKMEGIIKQNTYLREQLDKVLQSLTNPPLSIKNIDYLNRYNDAQRELGRYKKLFNNLYWKKDEQ